MKIAKEYHKNIYCLEGDWNKDLRKKISIKSTLEYLSDCLEITHIHRHCGVKEQFHLYMTEYNKKMYKNYSILYLAFHGNPNEILLGKEKLDLDEFEEANFGLFKNKIVHFGSCSSLNIDKKRLLKFVKSTDALCVSGYKTDVEFNKSTMLDILYFVKWQDYKDVRCVERDMKNEYKELVKSLEFTMIYN